MARRRHQLDRQKRQGVMAAHAPDGRNLGPGGYEREMCRPGHFPEDPDSWSGHRTKRRASRFWAADEGTGHSTGLDLAIVDDAGLLGERDRDLWDAMFSATSGRDGRMISMSILARGPMFAELRARKDEPAVFWQEFCPSPGSEKHIQDESVWHAANPGLRSGIKSLSYMRDAAARAAMNPAGLPNFLAYDLNLPQEPGREMILTPAQWQMCVVESPPERAGPVALGLDIGGSTSMTACVAYWPQVGRLEAWGAFPAEPDLQTRGLKDGTGQVYLRMEARDELRTYPGLVTPVGEFLRDVKTRLAGQRILSIRRRSLPESRSHTSLHRGRYRLGSRMARDRPFRDRRWISRRPGFSGRSAGKAGQDGRIDAAGKCHCRECHSAR